jgi:hypothetical protein
MFRWEPTLMAWSSFLTVKGICLLSESTPFAKLNDVMNFSTKALIASRFLVEKSPEAETSSSVTVSAASDKGDWALASST